MTTQPAPPNALKSLQAENRKLHRALRDLTGNVSSFLARLDKVMAESSTERRGQRIAALASMLDLVNDTVMHFGLGKSIKKIGKYKEKLEALAKREERP
jgi:hypothetical protein